MTDPPPIDGCEPKQTPAEVMAEQCKAVWTLVPEGRKIGKRGCLPLIAAAIKDIGYDAVFKNTKAWAAQMERDGIKRKHIMHPSTFFHSKKALYDGDWGDPKPKRKMQPGDTVEDCVGCGKRCDPWSRVMFAGDYFCMECKP